MTKRYTILVLIAGCIQFLYAQSNIQQSLSINTDGSSAASSAILDVQSDNKGVLIPRMSSVQRNAISTPAQGLLVYDTDTQQFWFYNGSLWVSIGNVGLITQINDADNDTKVQTEAISNENKIRFTLNGTERWRMNASRLENVNSGESVFIGENAGAADDLVLNKNTAVGHSALQNNTVGTDNLAAGWKALNANTNGNENVALGSQALFSNTVGVSNTAAGRNAMFSNTIGDYNVAVGYQSLFLNTTGFENVAIGNDALFYNTTGIGNTAIGSGASFTSTNLQNTTCIGYLAGGIANSDNRIEIGNTSVSFIGGQVNFSTYSDGRIKRNIRENVPGLAFILRLRPVTYHLDIRKQNQMCFGNTARQLPEWSTKYDIEKKRMTGFIAQEVEQAALETGFDFSGVDRPENEKGIYSLRYAEFVVPIVKAIQEQQVLISQLQKELEMLKQENQRIKATLAGVGLPEPSKPVRE